MHKIPTLLQRNPNNPAQVIPAITPGCEWVLNGEGVATLKWDGTCTKLDTDGNWWTRRTINPGKPAPANFVPVKHDPNTGKTFGWQPLDTDGKWWTRRTINPGKPAPDNFVPVEHDPNTGKTFGWEPANQSPFNRQLKDALAAGGNYDPGTYELCGPNINRNPHNLTRHMLIPHGNIDTACPTDIPGIINRVRELGTHWEGVVWWHPDGRQAKLKARDLPPRTPDMRTYPHGLQVTDTDGHIWIIWAGPDHDGHYAATPHTNDGHQGFEWLHTEDINPPEPPTAA